LASYSCLLLLAVQLTLVPFIHVHVCMYVLRRATSVSWTAWGIRQNYDANFTLMLINNAEKTNNSSMYICVGVRMCLCVRVWTILPAYWMNCDPSGCFIALWQFAVYALFQPSMVQLAMHMQIQNNSTYLSTQLWNKRKPFLWMNIVCINVNGLFHTVGLTEHTKVILKVSTCLSIVT
jgi:hypothetical protein